MSGRSTVGICFNKYFFLCTNRFGNFDFDEKNGMIPVRDELVVVVMMRMLGIILVFSQNKTAHVQACKTAQAQASLWKRTKLIAFELIALMHSMRGAINHHTNNVMYVCSTRARSHHGTGATVAMGPPQSMWCMLGGHHGAGAAVHPEIMK